MAKNIVRTGNISNDNFLTCVSGYNMGKIAKVTRAICESMGEPLNVPSGAKIVGLVQDVFTADYPMVCPTEVTFEWLDSSSSDVTLAQIAALENAANLGIITQEQLQQAKDKRAADLATRGHNKRVTVDMFTWIIENQGIVCDIMRNITE